LTLEEIAKNFGEEVAVHLTDATDEERAQLERTFVDRKSSVPSEPTEPTEPTKVFEAKAA
jgi:hypothetical protein